MRRTFAMLVAGLALSVVTGGCSTLNFVRPRLPPPTQTADGVTFRFYAPSASVVQLAGNWPENNWLAGQAQTAGLLVGAMRLEGPSGVWVRTEKLPPGRYQYKFVIDKVTWKEDPGNPDKTDDGYGGFNSLMDVR